MFAEVLGLHRFSSTSLWRYSLSPFWSVGKSHDPMPHRPRTVDRTRSPIEVSQKREYFKYQPETIDDFSLRLSEFGVQRQTTNLQKAAIDGHFSHLWVNNLQLPAGWLTLEDSNLHIPSAKNPFEVSNEFPRM